jgi:glutathione transport system permease protein
MDSGNKSPLQRAQRLADQGKREQAVAVLTAYLKQDINSEQGWWMLSLLLEDVGQRRFALEKVLSLNPYSEQARLRLAVLSAGGELSPDPFGPQPPSGQIKPVEVGRSITPAQIDMPEKIKSKKEYPVRKWIAAIKTRLRVPRKGRAAQEGANSELLRSLGQLFLLRVLSGALILALVIYITHLGLTVTRGATFQDAASIAWGSTLESISSLLRGDLGMIKVSSSTTNYGTISGIQKPITEVVFGAFVKSLGLLGFSMLIAIPIGVLLGTWAALRRHSLVSVSLLLISIVGVSLPSFFLALLFQFGVINLTRLTGQTWLPVGGFGWDKRIILPALVLAARPLAQVTRVTFSSLNDILEQDYVRTARSKGLTELLVRLQHVFPNALVPVLTTAGVSLRFSVSSLPVVEYFFGWAGLGLTLLQAIAGQDDDLTVALILSLGALFVAINVVLDLLYRLIDPRLRKTPEHISRQDGFGFLNWGRGLVNALVSIKDWLLIYNPIARRLTNGERANALETQGITALEEKQEDEGAGDLPTDTRHEIRLWLRGTLGNLPLVLGSLVVLGLVVMLFFGTSLTPHNPYTTRGMTFQDGEFLVPPFEPGDTYPWGTDVLGRDLMSQIIAGAQPTLTLITLVIIARLILGFVLGALAGWFNGSWFDRFALGLVETLAAFPTLILAMTLILAFGLRAGMLPFFLALSLVGWGEIMQFVRSEVMSLRPKMFIESAVAVGGGSGQIIFRHMLPNMVPVLISLAALETGAALMLLGELGFLGIFIGGGSYANLDIFGAPYHYSDVPEWGALLANIRQYARPYPWTGLYPALVFFVAILGLNLFGEGIRRLMETVGVRIAKLVNRYTLAAAALAIVGFIWLRGSTGTMAYYTQYAQQYDGQHALYYANNLSHPELMGRALGSPGQEMTAEYIAAEFKALGLQPAGEALSYFQTRKRDFATLDVIPSLKLDDGGPAPIYRQDFAEIQTNGYSFGTAHAPLVLVLMNELSGDENAYMTLYSAMRERNYEDRIILLLSDQHIKYFARSTRAGMLVVSDDPSDLLRRSTLSGTVPIYQYRYNREPGPPVPTLQISQALADRLLASTGETVASLRQQATEIPQDEIQEMNLDVQVDISMPETIHEKEPVRNVLGYIPGTAGSEGVPDYAKKDDELVVVMAQYDTPPLTPEGGVYPAANEATGVATMLEFIRNMRETGYQPYRTLMFIAYSGEGEEGGTWFSPDVEKFLQAKPGFQTSFRLYSIIELGNLGWGEQNPVVMHSNGSYYLTNLMKDAARRMDVNLQEGDVDVTFQELFKKRNVWEKGDDAPFIHLSRAGWQELYRLPVDSPDRLSAQCMDEAGRGLSLALMVLGRE